MSETMCCPLSNDGDGHMTVLDDRVVVARKQHACIECGEEIAKGARYECVKGVWEGSVDTYRTCLLCAEVRDHFSCGEGWVYSEVWDQLEENFFPDMKAGGQCMEGLSPEAKQYLIDRRMAWYFNQDEIDDSRWEDWKPPQRDHNEISDPETSNPH